MVIFTRAVLSTIRIAPLVFIDIKVMLINHLVVARRTSAKF